MQRDTEMRERELKELRGLYNLVNSGEVNANDAVLEFIRTSSGLKIALETESMYVDESDKAKEALRKLLDWKDKEEREDLGLLGVPSEYVVLNRNLLTGKLRFSDVSSLDINDYYLPIIFVALPNEDKVCDNAKKFGLKGEHLLEVFINLLDTEKTCDNIIELGLDHEDYIRAFVRLPNKERKVDNIKKLGFKDINLVYAWISLPEAQRTPKNFDKLKDEFTKECLEVASCFIPKKESVRARSLDAVAASKVTEAESSPAGSTNKIYAEIG